MSRKILTKQKLAILVLLYRFRFLNTHQIQKLLNHKNPTRIQTWLKELTTEQYIICDYNRHIMGENNKPAIYCLATRSKKELQELKECNSKILIRIYKEKALSTIFKQKQMF